MKRFILFVLLIPFLSCEDVKDKLSAQKIINNSIEVSGGDAYQNAEVSFEFREKKYISIQDSGKKILERINYTDSIIIRDVTVKNSFQRFINDSLISVSDSLASRYINSINSVHYFSRLPYGLNDKAVNKQLLGEVEVLGKKYHKIKVTFDQQDGGKDFEDIYLYWFDIESFKPDYLAYEFHVDGGGMRFRKAYNERFVEGIRFVDYENYKGNAKAYNFYNIDSVFNAGGLELLSKIELKNINVKKKS